MYRFLLFVHVLAVIAWVGAGYLFQVMSERIVRRGDAARMKSFIQTGSLVPPAYFGAMTAIVLASGVWLVLETGYGFDEPFVIGGLIGIAASGAIGGAIIGKTVERLRVLVESSMPDEMQLREGVARLRNVGRLDVAIVTAVVFLMTVKPGT